MTLLYLTCIVFWPVSPDHIYWRAGVCEIGEQCANLLVNFGSRRLYNQLNVFPLSLMVKATVMYLRQRYTISSKLSPTFGVEEF